MGLEPTGLPAHVTEAINKANPGQLAKMLEVGQGRLFETRKPGKAAINRQRGKTSQRKGNSFQKVIAASSGRGRVSVVELPKVGGFYAGKGKFINQKIPCDFIGAIRDPKAAVFFDAKTFGSSQRSFPLNDPNLVKPHQFLFLRAMADWGAVAGFLVEVRKLGEYRWLSAAGLDRTSAVEWSDKRWRTLGFMGELVQLDLLAEEVTSE
jgi:penicillin-binding protein-related factor A (putative recombinase)